jgi:hypothetical protein
MEVLMQEVINKTAPTDGAALALLEAFEKEASGTSTIRLPFRKLNGMIGGGLRKGYTSVVSGPPGNGKTYLAYATMLKLLEDGVRFKYIPLEYNATEHIRRMLGAYINSWGFIDTTPEKAQQRQDAVLNNPQILEKINDVEACICENPTKLELDASGRPTIPSIPYDVVKELIVHYAQEVDVLIIDPITAIDTDPRGGPEHEQQAKFIRNINAIAEYYDIHMMLIGHTKKRQKHNGKETNLTMDDVAGSVALSRFAQYLLLLDYHDETTTTVEAKAYLRKEVQHKRTMLVGKTNFGSGKGQRLAFDFVNGPLMEELGWIVTEDAN